MSIREKSTLSFAEINLIKRSESQDLLTHIFTKFISPVNFYIERFSFVSKGTSNLNCFRHNCGKVEVVTSMLKWFFDLLLDAPHWIYCGVQLYTMVPVLENYKIIALLCFSFFVAWFLNFKVIDHAFSAFMHPTFLMEPYLHSPMS